MFLAEGSPNVWVTDYRKDLGAKAGHWGHLLEYNDFILTVTDLCGEPSLHLMSRVTSGKAFDFSEIWLNHL